MPWETVSLVDEKRELVRLVQGRLLTMTAACEQFGISRKTGHKWLSRFEAKGMLGLEELSRAPKASPQRWRQETRAAVLELKRKRPHWGPKKLVAALAAKGMEMPAPSTAGEWLNDAGLVRHGRRQAHPSATPSGLRTPKAPNDLWCVDFKGHFRLGDGTYCYPLTVTDAVSRFLLGCDALTTTTMELAKPQFERLFRDYGLPAAIRSDNGSPFASVGLAGLSQLSVWWMKQAIRLERIPPGKPQHNGRHERMHRTLKGETAMPPAHNQRGQQRRFDAFRPDFNTERPHEALDMDVPANRYEPSGRTFREGPFEAEYPGHFEVRRVRPEGCIKWDGGMLYVSEALVGEQVGLCEVDDGLWQLHFCSTVIGGVDMRGEEPELIRP